MENFFYELKKFFKKNLHNLQACKTIYTVFAFFEGRKKITK